DIVQAAYALGASLLLGLGFGLMNGVIALAFPPWFTGYTLITMLLWFSSGVYFVPDAMPSVVREALAWLPPVQVIEWMRSAYYEGYGVLVLDRRYAIGFAVGAIFLGLTLERMIRGYVLGNR